MPALSVPASLGASAIGPISYIGSLYLRSATRLVFSNKEGAGMRLNGERVRQDHERWRNDDDIIKARLVAVGLSSVFSGLSVYAIVTLAKGDAVKLLGLHPRAALHLKPHLLAPLLYLGPLFAHYLSGTLLLQRGRPLIHTIRLFIDDWKGKRNYLVAPITEEFSFRSCILAVMLLGGFSHAQMVFLSPLWFGVAHIHHAWEIYNMQGRNATALKRAIATSLFQLTYTTLFGWYTSFLYLRTGSILPPITAHIFCNVLGPPNPVSEFEDNQSRLRRIGICLAYAAGIAGFCLNLWSWTASSAGLW